MIKRNIIANATGRAWGVISIYLFVPLYLKFLGIEAYGLVGFYSTLLSVLAFADMGFTATINREMARLSVQNDTDEEKRDLLRTFELTYICISLFLAYIIYIFAQHIATYWLHSDQLQTEEIVSAIRLFGAAIAFQLPSGLYIGGLMGLQRQVCANSLQIAWGIYRGVGGILVLWLLSPTITAFAIWQLVSNVIYCLTARSSLWRALLRNPAHEQARFKWQVFLRTWRYGAGMTGMAVISTLLTQSDKLAVSKMLTLEMLGFYTLAGSLAAAPLMLASPIASAVFPRLTELVAVKDHAQLARLYHRSSELVAVVIIPVSLTLVFFAADFIRAWTGIATTSKQINLAANFLLGGQLLQAITLVPFYLALAYGNVKLNLVVNSISVVLITPLLIYLISKFGIAGAGMSWLIINICTLPPYMYYLHHRLLPTELRRWSWSSFLRPLLVALPCVLICRWLTPHTESRAITFLLIFSVASVATIVTAITVPELRKYFLKKNCKVFQMLASYKFPHP